MENKKKIVIFSGAGVSRESGILTFRDNKDGLWNNHKIDDVATPSGWKKDRSLVLNFYNERRRQLPDVKPNGAHEAIANLEKDFDVTVVTQNVDDLHERAGSTNIIHLHGELTKARGSLYNNKPSPVDHVIDVGYNDINLGDKCVVTDSQLRPHIVWFGEYPFGVEEAYQAMRDADILIIVGTSLQIGYTLNLLNEVRHTGDSEKPQCEIYFVDPHPADGLLERVNQLDVNYIRTGAVEGMKIVIDNITIKKD